MNVYISSKVGMNLIIICLGSKSDVMYLLLKMYMKNTFGNIRVVFFSVSFLFACLTYLECRLDADPS